LVELKPEDFDGFPQGTSTVGVDLGTRDRADLGQFPPGFVNLFQ